MSTQINDGGPAFPQPNTYHPNGEVEYGSNGMTLRDWFAGKALANLPPLSADGYVSDRDLARDAYAIADAMIKEREADNGTR